MKRAWPAGLGWAGLAGSAGTWLVGLGGSAGEAGVGMERCLYAGAAGGRWVYAPAEAAMLVLGPPRSGKTTTVVVPNVLRAAGAVVATSTKTDVLAATLAARRRQGRCWVFDPTGAMAAPEGAEALRWSPLSGCGDWEAALARAHALARASRPGRGLMEATHWVERAEALIGPLLHAAARCGLGADGAGWVLRRELGEAIKALGGDCLAGDTLAGIDGTEDRERSGIFSTAASILAAYRSGIALAAACDPNFSATGFVRSGDTVCVCPSSTAQDQLAPLVVALLEEVRDAAYALFGGQHGGGQHGGGQHGGGQHGGGQHGERAPVSFVLDEVANIAPLPGLPGLVAEGGSQGVLTLACLQDLSQARVRWGDAAAGFLSLFGAKLVLPGIGDHATLALVSELCGEAEVASYSQSWGGGALWGPGGPRGSRSRSWVRRRRLPVDQVALGRAGHGLWIVGGAAPAWVQLTPWYSHSPWREVAAGAEAGPQRAPGWRPWSALGAGWRAWSGLGAGWRPWAVAGVVLAVLMGPPEGLWPLVAVIPGALWVWRGLRDGGVGRRRWVRLALWVLAVVVVLPASWWSVGVLVLAAGLAWRGRR